MCLQLFHSESSAPKSCIRDRYWKYWRYTNFTATMWAHERTDHRIYIQSPKLYPRREVLLPDCPQHLSSTSERFELDVECENLNPARRDVSHWTLTAGGCISYSSGPHFGDCANMHDAGYTRPRRTVVEVFDGEAADGQL